jgi:hypothetical protein
MLSLEQVIRIKLKKVFLFCFGRNGYTKGNTTASLMKMAFVDNMVMEVAIKHNGLVWKN